MFLEPTEPIHKGRRFGGSRAARSDSGRSGCVSPTAASASGSRPWWRCAGAPRSSARHAGPGTGDVRVTGARPAGRGWHRRSEPCDVALAEEDNGQGHHRSFGRAAGCVVAFHPDRAMVHHLAHARTGRRPQPSTPLPAERSSMSGPDRPATAGCAGSRCRAGSCEQRCHSAADAGQSTASRPQHGGGRVSPLGGLSAGGRRSAARGTSHGRPPAGG
jgi:hypothetical protein